MHVFFINQCNAQFLTIGFSSDYSTGRYDINCIVKLNTCFEADPLYWMDVKTVGFKLLSHLDLKRYRSKFPDEKDLQDEWKDAVTNRGKYVNLLVGQQTEEDQRRETDEENYYDDSSWEQKKRTFSWPTIRSRHKRVILHQGPMKRSTIRSSR